ncbi:MAG: hypothetical protein R3F05_17680 [Planctomycetota bacterium]
MQLPGVVREIVLKDRGNGSPQPPDRALERRLAQIAKELPEVEEIRRQLRASARSWPPSSSASWASCRALATPRPGRYAGLVPTRRGTGGDPRHGQISLEEVPPAVGARPAAAASYASRRPGSAVAAWIRTHQRHLGSKKKGLIAGARKLAESIWLLFHHGKDFDIRRPFGRYQPAA